MTTGTSLPPADRVGAIIVSAGASTRMQGEDKTLVDLGGEPLVARTLSAFELCTAVGMAVLVVAERSLEAVATLHELRRAGARRGLRSPVVCVGRTAFASASWPSRGNASGFSFMTEPGHS